MLFAALLYPTLAAGYCYLKNISSARYRVHWDTKVNNQYTTVLYYGMACILLAIALIGITIYLIYEANASYLATREDVLGNTIGSLTLCTTGNSFDWFLILSLVTLLCPYVYYLVYSISQGVTIVFIAVRYKFNLRRVCNVYYPLYQIHHAVETSPFDTMMLNSVLQFLPIMVTLENRKVYVGYVNSLCEPEESSGNNYEEISIVPLMSGHRDVLNMRIYFDNDYTNVLDTATHPLSIVIPRNRVINVSFFNFDVYDIVHSNNSAQAGTVRDTPQQ